MAETGVNDDQQGASVVSVDDLQDTQVVSADDLGGQSKAAANPPAQLTPEQQEDIHRKQAVALKNIAAYPENQTTGDTRTFRHGVPVEKTPGIWPSDQAVKTILDREREPEPTGLPASSPQPTADQTTAAGREQFTASLTPRNRAVLQRRYEQNVRAGLEPPMKPEATATAEEAAGHTLAPPGSASTELDPYAFQEERINAKTGQVYRDKAVPEASSFLEDPLMWIASGAEPVATGLSRIHDNDQPVYGVNPKDPFGPPVRMMSEEDEKKQSRQKMLGAAEVLEGTGRLGTVALPASLIGKPIATAGAIAFGMALSEGGGDALHGHVSPEAEELGRQLFFFVPSAFGVLSGLRTSTLETPQGRFGVASMFGGRVRAGVAETPDVYTGRVRVGGTQFEVNIPRGGGAAAGKKPPELIPPEAAPAPQEGAQALIELEQAAGNKQYQPPPPVPGSQGPENHLSPEVVQGITTTVLQLPPEARTKAMLEAHANLTKWIMTRGTFVGPDGKVHTVANPGQAKNLASKFINDQVEAEDRAREDSQKAAEKETKERQKQQPALARAQRSSGGPQVVDVDQLGATSTQDKTAQVTTPVQTTETTPIVPRGTIPVEGVVDGKNGPQTGAAGPEGTQTPSVAQTPQQQPAAGADDTYKQAVKLVVDFGKASTSLLQRRLRIGYGVAANLIDRMAAEGIVSKAEQSKPREVLARPEWLREDAPGERVLPTTAPVSGTEGDKQPMGREMTQDSPAVEKVAQEAQLVPGQEPLVMVKKETPENEAALAQPPKPVSDAAVQRIGDEDKESGRTIVQPSNDEMQNERLAGEAAPVLATQLSQLSASVPGITFDRMRPQKNMKRVDEKVEQDDKPPKTIADYLAAQIAADSPQAKDQLIAEMKKHMDVVSVEDKFLEGRPDLAGYPSANVQVKMPNGSTAEVQIVPREVQEVTDESHRHYTDGRKAELAGDLAARDKAHAEAKKINTEALDRFKERNGIGTKAAKEEEGAFPRGKQLPGISGAKTNVKLDNGSLPATYQLVEADKPITSHHALTFAKNMDYPSGVQERAYHSDKEAQARVENQTNDFQFDYLVNTNPDAVNGPPVLEPGAVVLGGNSRMMTIQRMYAQHKGERQTPYQQALKEHAHQFGYEPEDVDGFKKPALVRVLDKPPATIEEANRIASELNRSKTGALTASQKAVSAAKKVSESTLKAIQDMAEKIGPDATLREVLRDRGNEVIQRLVEDGAISERERPQYLDAHGAITDDGKNLVVKILRGTYITDPDLLDRIPAGTLAKLDSSLMDIAYLATRDDGYNILPMLEEALAAHADMAEKHLSVSDFLRQGALFGGGRTPDVDALIKTLGEPAQVVRKAIHQFTQDAKADKPGQATLALGPEPSPLDSFGAAFHVDPKELKGRAPKEAAKPKEQPTEVVHVDELEKEPAERRQNSDLRKRVDQMTPEEKTRALLTNEKTGLPNYRAFQEDREELAQTHQHVGYADLDDFKQFNTALGHYGVDTVVLPAVGDLIRDAIAREPGGSIRPYHRSGDEFLFLSTEPERVGRVAKRINDRLAEAVFTIKLPNGKTGEKKGTGLSYGVGKDEASAESAADRDKQSRKEAGLRTGERDKTGDAGLDTAGKHAPEPEPAGAARVQEQRPVSGPEQGLVETKLFRIIPQGANKSSFGVQEKATGRMLSMGHKSAGEALEKAKRMQEAQDEHLFAAEKESADDLTSSRTGAERLANSVYEALKQHRPIGNVTDLNRMAEEAFGSSRVSGEWTPKDAFDAMEGGVNKFLLERGKELMEMDVPGALATLRNIMERLPSQSVRTDEQVKNQQFSTPPTEAYVVARVAGLTPQDLVLEPSAGNGGLAIWAKAIGAETYVNEISPRRQAMLKMIGFDHVTSHDGELINALLGGDVKPTVIVMNPPFSASTMKAHDAPNRNLYGFNHVESALQRLADGGRLVTILGGGRNGFPNEGATFQNPAAARWFAKLGQKYNIRANVRIAGKEYQKYGTNFATRIIVIDKDGPTPSQTTAGQERTWATVKQGEYDTLEEAYNALSNVAETRPQLAGRRGGISLGQSESAAGLGANQGVGGAGDRGLSKREPETGGEVQPAGGPERPGRELGRDQSNPSSERVPLQQSGFQFEGRPEGGATPGTGGPNQDGRTERQIQFGQPAAEAQSELALERRESESHREEEDTSAYVAYKPSLKGPDHPGAIVETKTMATVPLPEISYRPALPDSVIKEGKLSAVQLEAVSIAGQQNEIILPGGFRGSALIGDGTGVGKGREAAAILWDNWRKGRRRLVWVSVNWDLMQDAMRDLNGIGAVELARNIKPLGKLAATAPIEHQGVLFTSYPLMRSEDKRGNTRIAQLKRWLVGNDEGEGGYVVFDESHMLKNAVAGAGGEPSQIGQIVKAFMQEVPKLRSVSLSATAATDVVNLGYLDRLGLWGPGTAFPNGFNDFAAQIGAGGMSAMEMVARELKAQGKYVSRTLSYKGVEYSEIQHEITPEQKELYRSAVKAWRLVSQRVEDSIMNTTNGGARAKSRFMSLFYASQQRFFNVLLTTLKIPTAVEQSNQALANGKSVVISLVNTNEAAQNREKNKYRDADDSDEIPDYDFGPGEMLVDLVREHYPTQQWKDDVDSAGNSIKVPAFITDEEGREIPLINPTAVKERDALVKELQQNLKMPANPLDILIEQLGGPNKVAEITGRKERYDEASGKFVSRGGAGVKRDDINKSEERAFQGGKKRVAILSSAGGTGISLHAGHDVDNQQRRFHITLQVGWSADRSMQMLGRTNRSNQKVPPEYALMKSNLGGENRFVSTIARRLGSLEALGKGQTKTNAGTEMMDKVNFETDQGRQAANSFYTQLLKNGPVPGTKLKGMQVLTDLGVLKPSDTGGMTVPPKDRTNVTRLLNRLLALDPDVQNAVYDYYYDIFEATVKQAVEDGKLDTGVKTMPGDRFKVNEQRVIGTDPQTKAQTFYYPIEAHEKTDRVSPKELEKSLIEYAPRNARVVRGKDGKLALLMDAKDIVHADGRSEKASYVVTPADGKPKKFPNAKLYGYQEISEWAKAQKEELEIAVHAAERDLKYAQQAVAKYSSDRWAQERVGSAERELAEKQKALADAHSALKEPLAAARQQWQEQYDQAPDHRTVEHHLIGGAVLRWWNPIREATGQFLNIYTAVDSDSGRRVVGVEVPGNEIEKLLSRISGNQSTVNARQLMTDVLHNGTRYELEGGIQVRRGRVSRNQVVQLIPPNANVGTRLKDLGVIYERGMQPVYYLPEGDKGHVAIRRVLKEFPAKVEAPEPQKTGEPSQPEPQKTRRTTDAITEHERAVLQRTPAGRGTDGITLLTHLVENGLHEDEANSTIARLVKRGWLNRIEDPEADGGRFARTPEGTEALKMGAAVRPSVDIADTLKQSLEKQRLVLQRKLKAPPTDKEIAQYYKPGMFVPSYGGGRDQVVEFHPATSAVYPNNRWSVDVIAVDKNGKPIPGERVRNHTTPPQLRELNQSFNFRQDIKEKIGQIDQQLKQGTTTASPSPPGSPPQNLAPTSRPESGGFSASEAKPDEDTIEARMAAEPSRTPGETIGSYSQRLQEHYDKLNTGTKKEPPDTTGFEPGTLRMALPIPIKSIQNFYTQDVAPVAKEVAGGLREIALKGAAILAPRTLVRSQDLDAAMRMKGKREEEAFRWERAVRGLQKMFDRMPDADKIDFMDRARTGQLQRTVKLDDALDFLRKSLEPLRTLERQYRPTLSDKENYFPTRWEVVPGSGKVKTQAKSGLRGRPLEGPKSFMKQQTLKDVSEGLQAGGKLISTNPVDHFRARIVEGLRFVTARQMFDEWLNEPYTIGAKGKIYHTAQYFKEGDWATARTMGYQQMDDPMFRVLFPAQSGEGLVKVGEYWVEENAHRILTNFLSYDWFKQSKVGRGIMWVKNQHTAWRLGFSPFHLITESILAAGSEAGRGFEHGWNQGVRHVLDRWITPKGKAASASDIGKAIIDGAITASKSGAAPFTLSREGGSIVRYIDDPISFLRTTRGRDFIKQYPEAQEMIHDLFTGGGRLTMDEGYRTHAVESLMQAAANHNYIGALLRTPFAANQLLQYPLFEMYIPRLKAGLFFRELGERFADRFEEMASGKLTRENLARQVWTQIDNRFGEINWSNRFWNSTFKTSLQLIFRALAWTEGNMRFTGSAIGGQAREFMESAKFLKDAATGSDTAKPGTTAIPRLDPMMARILGMALIGAVLHTLLQLYFTHEFPKDWKDVIAPRDGTDDSHGRSNRWVLPLVPFKDLFQLRESPINYAYSKLADPWTAIGETIHNRDFQGHLISHPGDPYWEQMFDKAVHGVGTPIGVGKFLEARKQGEPAGRAALGELGLSRVGKQAAMSAAERKMLEIQRSHYGQPIDEEQERIEQRQARQASGDYSPQEMGRMIRESMKDEFEAGMERFSLEEVQAVLDAADTEEEQMMISRILLKKQFGSRRTSY
ncbi:MAG TPA: strawberry notch family protein [Candidatus Angelobacter sp.]|nr:strawberry notch family protein [Candidatus Angelobacter sp.]